jgi:diguanylate cyclase (GGDEF)-like protein
MTRNAITYKLHSCLPVPAAGKSGLFTLSALTLLTLIFSLQSALGLPEAARLFLGPGMAILSIFTAYYLSYPGLAAALSANLITAALLYSRWTYSAEPAYPVIFALLLYSTAGAIVITIIKSKEKASQQNLKWLSAVDCLTEVYNHRYFQQRLSEEMARARRSRSPLSLVFVDIDCFKQYNDGNGHVMGDVALKKTAAFLNERTRIHDIVCRYGGDEFVIILPETEAADAAVISERLVDTYPFIEIPGRLNSPVKLTLSIGISAYPNFSKNMEELIQHADSALYTVKKEGKNSVRIYSEDIGVNPALDRSGFCYDRCENSLVKSYRKLVADLSVKLCDPEGNEEEICSSDNSLIIGRILGLSHTKMDPARLSACLDELKLH